MKKRQYKKHFSDIIFPAWWFNSKKQMLRCIKNYNKQSLHFMIKVYRWLIFIKKTHKKQLKNYSKFINKNIKKLT